MACEIVVDQAPVIAEWILHIIKKSILDLYIHWICADVDLIVVEGFPKNRLLSLLFSLPMQSITITD